MTEHFQGHPAGPDLASGFGQQFWTFGGLLTREEIRRARRWLIVAGVLALIIGIASIAVPVVASVTIAMFVGWVLVAAGITVGIHAVSHRASVRGLEALITLVAGLYILVFPLSGTVSLTFVLAVWLLASGVLSFIYAAQRRSEPGSWTYMFGSVLSVILGLLVAVGLPSSAAWAIGLLVGVNLMFWGLRALVGAWLLKDLERPGRQAPA